MKGTINTIMDHGSARRSFVSFQRHCTKAGIAFAALLALGAGTVAFAGENVTHAMEKVTPYEYRGDVRELAKVQPAAPPQKRPYVHPVLRPPRTEKVPSPPGAQKALSMNVPLNAPLAPMPAAIVNFAGMSFNDPCTGGACGGGWPPDVNGDVGPNYYVQAVNNSYAIYNKTGGLLASFTEDSLWSPGGTNPCNGNSQGDPVVLYDQLADRWILTHFAFSIDSIGNPVSPFYQCIAVSKTSNPVSGGWWLYPLRMDPGGAGKPPVGTINDYSKFGVWTDCLYMSSNEFTMPSGAFAGTSYVSLSRSDLESGAALTWSLGFINDTNDPFTMIPSNVLGAAAASLPPAGTPNYFVSESQTTNAFEVRKFIAGPNCGAGGTLGAPAIVSQTNYSLPSNFSIVPQPGTTNKLDMIDDRLMQKVRYRNIGGTESLWVVHNVMTSATGTVVPQWAQINVTAGTVNLTPAQEEIYAPDTALHRWMGSLAVDNAGNMALGYSTSSSTQFPSIAYSGRLAGDAAGSLPQTEVQLVTGAGSQTFTSGGAAVDRWGDYTAMSVDPSDDCTFWYTNQYYSSAANGASGNWQTRIGSFKFSSCIPVLASAPVVTTTPISGTISISAAGGGNVIAAGGAAVTARGVCWNTTGAPTTADPHTSDGAGTGIFSSTITGLVSNTTYFLRAYATNSVGTAYGNEVSFTTVIRPSPPTGLTVM